MYSSIVFQTLDNLVSESSLATAVYFGGLDVIIALNCSIAEYNLSIVKLDWLRDSN